MNATNTATFTEALSLLNSTTSVFTFEAAARSIVSVANGKYFAALLIMDAAKIMRETTTVVQMQLWFSVATVLHEIARTSDTETKAAITKLEIAARNASLLYS